MTESTLRSNRGRSEKGAITTIIIPWCAYQFNDVVIGPVSKLRVSRAAAGWLIILVGYNLVVIFLLTNIASSICGKCPRVIAHVSQVAISRGGKKLYEKEEKEKGTKEKFSLRSENNFTCGDRHRPCSSSHGTSFFRSLLGCYSTKNFEQ